MKRLLFRKVDQGWDFVTHSDKGTDEGALKEAQHYLADGECILVVSAEQVKPLATEYRISKKLEFEKMI